MVLTPWGDVASRPNRARAQGAASGREAARREQRERLFGAMVANCETKGFKATSVADLLEASGVSRGTFYALFDDKLDCFRAAEEEIIRLALAAAARRLGGRGEAEARARAAFDVYVELVVAQPAAARMCQVECYAAGEVGTGPVREAIEAVASLGREALDEMPGRAGMPAELVRAIVGGFFQVLYNRLRAGREAELAELADPLWDWAMSYRPPPRPLRRPGRRPAPAPAGDAPPFAAYDPEQRIIRAFATVVAEKGYPATTVADVCAAAAISQSTFYRHFGDRSEAFRAALDSSGAQMLAASLPRARRAPDWPAAVRVALEAACGFMAAEPAFARLRMVEVYSAGLPAIAVRDEAGMELIGTLLGHAFTEHPDVSEVVVEATVGAILGVYYEAVRRGGGGELLDAAPLLTYLVLAPILGADVACDAANGTDTG